MNKAGSVSTYYTPGGIQLQQLQKQQEINLVLFTGIYFFWAQKSAQNTLRN
jgi:hypothetical protein